MRTEVPSFPSIPDLPAAGHEGSLRDPSRLLRELTNLFVTRSTPSDMEVLRFEDIACRLAQIADAATLTYVAARISSHPSAPVILIDTLIQRDPMCGKILVEHCNRVSPRHLMAFADHENPSMAAAVARRRNISPALARALAQRSELSVLRDLAANPNVELTGPLLSRLVTIARNDNVLAQLLLMRAADHWQVAPLFMFADREQRREIINAAEQQSFPASELRSIRLMSPALVSWLTKRDIASSTLRIAAELARVIQVPRSIVEILLNDRRGDGLAIVLAAAGMPSPEAGRVLLHCPPEISHSSERVRALMAIIERLPAHAARRIIQTIAGDGINVDKTGATYQPLNDIAAASTPSRAIQREIPSEAQRKDRIRILRTG